MFTSISGPELLMIVILGLLLFGPWKLPQMGRTIGKALAEFRRTTTDFKMKLEREVEASDVKDVAGEANETVREIEGAVSRDVRDDRRDD